MVKELSQNPHVPAQATQAVAAMTGAARPNLADNHRPIGIRAVLAAAMMLRRKSATTPA